MYAFAGLCYNALPPFHRSEVDRTETTCKSVHLMNDPCKLFLLQVWMERKVDQTKLNYPGF